MKRGILVLAALFTLGFGRDGRAEYDVNSQEYLDMMMAGAQAGAQEGGYFTSFVAPPPLTEEQMTLLQPRVWQCDLYKIKIRKIRADEPDRWRLEDSEFASTTVIEASAVTAPDGTVEKITCRIQCVGTSTTRLPTKVCPDGYRLAENPDEKCLRASILTTAMLEVQPNHINQQMSDAAVNAVCIHAAITGKGRRACEHSAATGNFSYTATQPTAIAQCVVDPYAHTGFEEAEVYVSDEDSEDTYYAPGVSSNSDAPFGAGSDL